MRALEIWKVCFVFSHSRFVCFSLVVSILLTCSDFRQNETIRYDAMRCDAKSNGVSFFLFVAHYDAQTETGAQLAPVNLAPVVE